MSDRFIPDRSAINSGYAQYAIKEGKEKPPAAASSPYEKHLAEALGINKETRILPINKPPAPSSSQKQDKHTKPKPQTPKASLEPSSPVIR